MKNVSILIFAGITLCSLVNAHVMQDDLSVTHHLIPITYHKDSHGHLMHMEIIKNEKCFNNRVKKADLPVVMVVGPRHSTVFHEEVCFPVAQKIRQVRFVSLNPEKNPWFLNLLKERLAQKKEEFQYPMVIFLNKGKVILPISSGTLKEKQLVQEVYERFALGDVQGVR